MRQVIEITPEQHRKLKATVAVQGKSIRDYVLDRTLPDTDEKAALQKLEDFLKPRLEAANRGEWSDRTVAEVFDAARERKNRK